MATKDYNDNDVKFVQDMIPHHQIAVTMAISEYAYGENEEVLAWARDIWESQQEQIDGFRAWLKARGLPEKSAAAAKMKMGK